MNGREELLYRLPSSCGTWRIAVRGSAIRRIILPPSPPERRGGFRWLALSADKGGGRRSESADFPPVIKFCMRQLELYFRGRLARPSLRLDLPMAPPFTGRIWDALRRIPFGRRVTYGEIAAAAGSAGAYRAAGNACASNPVPIFIPCHRVVGKKGEGGFSSGLSWKRFLLDIERRPPRE